MDFAINTTIEPLGENLYAVEQGMVRSFLILGTEAALLLDTGAADEDLMGILAGVTALPIIVCMTHSDGDHTGGLSRFPSAYAHRDEVPLFYAKNPGLATKLLPVEEGHVFHLGGRDLAVIHNPGHTPGSISLLDRENRLLFSGDTLSRGPVFLFGEYRNLGEYQASLDKLAALSSRFDAIYPCHNTCPLDTTVISDLQACARGIASGTLPGHQPTGMLPPGESPMEYTVGQAGIYF